MSWRLVANLGCSTKEAYNKQSGPSTANLILLRYKYFLALGIFRKELNGVVFGFPSLGKSV